MDRQTLLTESRDYIVVFLQDLTLPDRDSSSMIVEIWKIHLEEVTRALKEAQISARKSVDTNTVIGERNRDLQKDEHEGGPPGHIENSESSGTSVSQCPSKPLEDGSDEKGDFPGVKHDDDHHEKSDMSSQSPKQALKVL